MSTACQVCEDEVWNRKVEVAFPSQIEFKNPDQLQKTQAELVKLADHLPGEIKIQLLMLHNKQLIFFLRKHGNNRLKNPQTITGYLSQVIRKL